MNFIRSILSQQQKYKEADAQLAKAEKAREAIRNDLSEALKKIIAQKDSKDD